MRGKNLIILKRDSKILELTVSHTPNVYVKSSFILKRTKENLSQGHYTHSQTYIGDASGYSAFSVVVKKKVLRCEIRFLGAMQVRRAQNNDFCFRRRTYADL